MWEGKRGKKAAAGGYQHGKGREEGPAGRYGKAATGAGVFGAGYVLSHKTRGG